MGIRGIVPVLVCLALTANATVAGGEVPPLARAPRLASTSAIAQSPASTPRIAASWPDRIARRLDALRSRSVTRPAEASSIDPALATELSAIAAEAGPSTKIGISVRALDSGATLFEASPDLALNPASNHKLVTAIAALELLGGDYRFETTLLRDGDTLVLVGEGDPSLQPEDLRELAKMVASTAGMPTIRRIVIDDGAFTPERFGPGYDPTGPGFSYLAPSGALSLQWNTVEIEVTPTVRGEPVAVTVSPACAHVEVEVVATTGRRKPLEIETRPLGDRTRIVVKGGLSSRSGPTVIRRRIADPGLFTGSVLARALADLGLPEPEVVRGSAPAQARPIARHISPPLAEVLHSALKYSNNFTTEQILRTLGHRATGEPGDWRNGRETIARFLRALGRDPDELVFENAAGYSQRGRASARTLVDLLHFGLTHGAETKRLLAALAIAGTDGTLRDRLHDVAGRVLAKTGSLAGTSALTGVIVDEDGTPRLGFSILLNGAVDRKSGARLQDRLVRALLSHA